MKNFFLRSHRHHGEAEEERGLAKSEYQWTGNVIDLMEICVILWRSKKLRNKEDISPSLVSICDDVFTHFGLEKRSYPFSLLYKIRKRTDFEHLSLCWRVLFWLYSVRNVKDDGQ